MEPSERDRETAWALWRGSYITEADAIRATAAALAKERERCAAVADNEPEPDGSMPDALQMAAPEDIARAVVRATRKSIAAAIRAGSAPEETPPTTDFPTPEADGWHWLRGNCTCCLFVASYDHANRRWLVLSNFGVAAHHSPAECAKYFTYIAPATPPEETKP